MNILEVFTTELKSSFHPADCECNQPSLISQPSNASIIASMVKQVVIGFIVGGIVFIVAYVGYQFFTA